MTQEVTVHGRSAMGVWLGGAGTGVPWGMLMARKENGALASGGISFGTLAHL
jgi:hypothetical protein